VQALFRTAEDHKYDFKILRSVMTVNQLQKTALMKKIRKFYKNNIAGKTFAFWGLAFKPNTDDIREAPALYMIDELLEAGAKVQVYDPEAMNNVKKMYGEKIQYMTDEYAVLQGADSLVIATEWSVFRQPDFDRVKVIKDNAIFDGRNLYDLDKMKALRFNYESIGRSAIRVKTKVH
jgi:UDPglucose 6-dehydrogenase